MSDSAFHRAQQLAEAREEEVERDRVLAALGHDEVGITLGWLDELQVHGADGAFVLLDDAFHGPAPLGDVALEAADEPDVGVRVDVDLHVEERPQLGLGVDEDAVHENDLARLDAPGLGRAAVGPEVVDRRLDDHSLLERLEVAHEKLALERIRMVEVLPLEDVLRKVDEVAVIRIVGEDGDALLTHPSGNRVRDRRLARARSARDADEKRCHLKPSASPRGCPPVKTRTSGFRAPMFRFTRERIPFCNAQHDCRRIAMGNLTRRKFLVSGGVLALSPLAVSRALAQGKTIKIGAVYPLTGNLASTGIDCRRGVELAVDIINGKYDLNLPLARTEGIPGLGGARLEVVWADTKGEPKNGQAEAERLITQDQVVGVIGAYQSSVTKTASQATERLKVPYVCSDSSSPTLTERGLKYFFRVSPHDGIFAHDQFNFLRDLDRVKKQKVQSVALLYENTEFGSNVGKQEQKYAQEYGYKVVADISYTANATDVTSEVGRLIKANPDVLMHASYITDAILFTKTFKEMGFNPKGMLTMAGYIEPGYLPAVKADGNFIIVRSTFALDLE